MNWIDAARDHIGDLKTADEMAWADTWISSGNYGLNYAISNRFQRGYPAGHAVEIFGEPGTGKTLLVARAFTSVQQMGGRALLEDSEGGFNPNWAERVLGVDPEGLLMFSPDEEAEDFGTVKQHYGHLRKFLSFVQESGEDVPYVLALDSLGGLTTTQEKGQDFEKTDVGRKAKMLHKLFRLVKARMKTLSVVYIVTNHVYDSPTAYSKQKSSGGKALKFHSSVRIGLRNAQKVDDEPEDGNLVRGWIEKNRCGPDQREFEFFLPENRAISPYSGLIPALEDAGLTAMAPGYRVAYDPSRSPQELASEGLPSDKESLKEISTGIRAHKTSPVKQERAAKKLVDEYPKILDHADAMLEAREDQVEVL